MNFCDICDHTHFDRPPMKLGESKTYTGFCLSTGVAWVGIPGPMSLPRGGYAWSQVPSWDVRVPTRFFLDILTPTLDISTLRTYPPPTYPPPPALTSSGGHRSGRCASYWIGMLSCYHLRVQTGNAFIKYICVCVAFRFHIRTA